MALTAAGESISPGDLNSWLNAHGGFTHGDWIIWGAINGLGGMKLVASYSSLSLASLEALVDSCHPVVVNVRDRTHYVLVTGNAGGGNFYTNDPGSHPAPVYAYSGMSQFVVYTSVARVSAVEGESPAPAPAPLPVSPEDVECAYDHQDLDTFNPVPRNGHDHNQHRGKSRFQGGKQQGGKQQQQGGKQQQQGGKRHGGKRGGGSRGGKQHGQHWNRGGW